ncbi:hypothetical protein [Actibacterium sp. D379-3]
MSDITELERRITAALERIGKGAEALSAARADAGAAADETELTRLTEALEAEKTANAQLEERVKAIRDKQDTHLAQLESRVSKLGARAEAAEKEIDRLRRINAELRENNAALRAANAEGLGDAHLINKSMLTELDALRALRDGDRAELDEIIEELTPLTGEDINA